MEQHGNDDDGLGPKNGNVVRLSSTHKSRTNNPPRFKYGRKLPVSVASPSILFSNDHLYMTGGLNTSDNSFNRDIYRIKYSEIIEEGISAPVDAWEKLGISIPDSLENITIVPVVKDNSYFTSKVYIFGNDLSEENDLVVYLLNLETKSIEGVSLSKLNIPSFHDVKNDSRITIKNTGKGYRYSVLSVEGSVYISDAYGTSENDVYTGDYGIPTTGRYTAMLEHDLGCFISKLRLMNYGESSCKYPSNVTASAMLTIGNDLLFFYITVDDTVEIYKGTLGRNGRLYNFQLFNKINHHTCSIRVSKITSGIKENVNINVVMSDGSVYQCKTTRGDGNYTNYSHWYMPNDEITVFNSNDPVSMREYICEEKLPNRILLVSKISNPSDISLYVKGGFR